MMNENHILEKMGMTELNHEDLVNYLPDGLNQFLRNQCFIDSLSSGEMISEGS
jgi:hypothetical protein